MKYQIKITEIDLNRDKRFVILSFGSTSHFWIWDIFWKWFENSETLLKT